MNLARKPLKTADYPAQILDCDINKIYDLCRRKMIPHIKVGRLYRFDEDALEVWIQSGGTPIKAAA